MATNTFVLTKDLEQLTEEERRLHLENVCASLGLDSKAGLLKYARMDRGDGSGERHLVLYATKGATDKLRDIHGVDVIEMTDKVIGGAIVYTAKGKNKAGRIDIAVGAAAIENKHGENLAKAFAISQTRASRRLTLQFSGSGLIDESEVSESVAPTASAQMSFPEVVQPTAASSAAGVDVTGLTVKEPPTKVSLPPVVEEPRLKNPAEGLKPIGVMAAPDGKKPTARLAAQVEEQIAPEAAVVPAEGSIEAPKRRRRRTKAEMEAARAAEAAEDHSDVPVGVIEDPKQPQAAATAAEEPLRAPVATPVAESAAVIDAPAPASEKSKTKVTVPLLGDKPNQEQMTLYVNRLMKYSDDILPGGGMIPSQGMGPRKKVREFMKIVNTGADLNQLTVLQWENSFRYLDQMLEQKGAVELAKVIEYNLETANEPETVTA